MLKIILALFISLAHAQAVNNNTYLIFPTQAAALARSQSQCVTLKCDGTYTKYWWNIIGPLSAGTAGSTSVAAGSYAVEVQPSGPFAATTNSVKTAPCAVGCGLTSTEQGQLVTAAQIAPLLPVATGQAVP